ncbi:MAG TPA: DEAD/DEAH box helicase family protein [Solirubrobacteraceae bacterium]
MSTSVNPPKSPLRAWQVRALEQLETWDGGPFLISAAPGAGKTRPALELARRLLAERTVARVVVVCPTTPLTRQWARAAARLGVHLAPDARSSRPPGDFDGVVITYARLASNPTGWARGITPQTLVIADEAHHLGEELAWGTAFAAVFRNAPRWLLLSGTPFRSDATPIPGVRYDADGTSMPDVSYTYSEAVGDGVCRRVGFITYDGTLSWRSGDDVIESSFETVLSTREASRRYRTATSTELPDGLPRILREAHAKLVELRAGGHPDAGGLVIAADRTHAIAISRLMRETTGRAPVVVLHTEARAALKLAAFTASTDPWIVAVNMVSEGVDIPRLRVGVYATAAKTPLIFRQIVGRFVRTISGRPIEASWLYLPADPILRAHASAVEGELRQSLRRVDDDGIFDEPREPRRTERSPTPDFVALSADVAPQLTLFGAPPKPAPAAAARRALAAEESPTPPAAFELRAGLRSQRHRLVSDLRRRDGRSHAEINTWLNRAVGITRVEDATIDQLEQTIELLLGTLTARR